MRDELSIPTEVPEDFAPTPPSGLTEEEAQARREQGLGNVSRADAGKSVGRISVSYTHLTLPTICSV